MNAPTAAIAHQLAELDNVYALQHTTAFQRPPIHRPVSVRRNSVPCAGCCWRTPGNCRCDQCRLRSPLDLRDPAFGDISLAAGCQACQGPRSEVDAVRA